MKIYGDALSGNCQKVRLLADHLGLPYAWVPINTLKSETRTPDYLAKFPQGQVPAIELGDGRCLAQSNAIMRYLARGSPLLPDNAWTQAKIDEWLFWEQYSHEPYIAVCRFHMLYQGKPKEAREAWRVERGERALDLMESALAGRDWLAANAFTIADIALLAYTRLAPEGGFDLRTRPNLRAWIARSETVLGLTPGSGVASP
jgi:glutathione S-transferase